jgi:hypothetical protein
MDVEPSPEPHPARRDAASARGARPRSPWRVRVLFAFSIVFVVYTTLNRELYPGVQAPRFGNPGVANPSDAPVAPAQVRVRLRDGREEIVSLAALLERAHFKQRPRIEASLLRERDAAGEPVARAWVVGEVARRFAGRGPVWVEAFRGPAGDDPGGVLFAAPVPEAAP